MKCRQKHKELILKINTKQISILFLSIFIGTNCAAKKNLKPPETESETTETQSEEANINIARDIASDIWFNWNRYYLGPEDDFLIGREKMLQVAIDLFPGNSSIYQTLCNAWASVGIGDTLLSGDVNSDTIINVQDIIILIGFILGSIEPTEDQLFIGDVNLDGIIDVLDIVLVVNIIFQ